MSSAVYVTFIDVACYKCKATFGVVENAYTNLRNTHEIFYCVHCGASQAFREQSEAEKLRDELNSANGSLNFWRDRARAEERSKAALRGVITKTRKRVGNGVCPCCTRSFQNLRRHMATKHPGYVKEES